jgi:hypothetical protein
VHALLGFLLVVSAHGGSSEPRCTIQIINRYTGPRLSGYVNVRATPDSVFEGVYHRLMLGTGGTARIPEYSAQSGQRVYGQVFELLTAEETALGDLKGYSRVVLIWWQHDHSCRRQAPRSALRVQGGEVFVLQQPRSSADWVAGMPTFDIEPGNWVYSPELDRPSAVRNGAARTMTLTEFMEYFRLIPRFEDHPQPLPSEVMQRFLKWGDENPERWTLWPARIALCHALEVTTGQYPASRCNTTPR